MTLPERAEKLYEELNTHFPGCPFNPVEAKAIIESELRAAVEEAVSGFIDKIVLCEIDDPIAKKIRNEALEKAAQVVSENCKGDHSGIPDGQLCFICHLVEEILALKSPKGPNP